MALPILAHWAGRSIFDIEPAALARRGIRRLLADLDNTLAPYGEPEPTQAVRDWAAALGEQGITLFVLSNNRHPERPRRFSQALGVPFLKKLAYASDVTVEGVTDAGSDDAMTAQGMVTVTTHAARLFMPLAELVDLEKEKARLEKELKNLKAELVKL